MRIISISRGSHAYGIQFAQLLAKKLGFECISREDLLEEGAQHQIPIGKLETAIVKPHIRTDRLTAELEHYKALATSILCEKALDHDIIYHGRTGHLLLPGIDHILRIRVVSDMEHRIASVMERLGLSRRKATQYIQAVEDDRRKWVKEFYNVDWDDYTLYDMVVNLSRLDAGNAATAACTMAQLPEFQATPASISAMKNALLAARARLLLAGDERTAGMSVKVTADRGTVHVTYSFLQGKRVAAINQVLEELPDASDIICTEAQTNVLWIQEAFDASDKSCEDVLSLASTWDAAVDILKLQPRDIDTRLPVTEEIAKRGLETWRRTGILEEAEDMAPREPEDVSRMYERLVNSGRAGGKHVLRGSLTSLLDAIDRSVSYRLVVFDNAFLNKSPEARKRSIREWSNVLSESLQTPVVTTGEIHSRYRFGLKQAVQMLLAAVATAAILFAIFENQTPIIELLKQDSTFARIATTTCIVIFVPVFAYLYSSATSRFLRMIKLD